MTHPLAALIAGVPRYSFTGKKLQENGWMHEDAVLAALEAATPPDLVEAGKRAAYIANECLQAAKALEETDTFQTGQAVYRDASAQIIALLAHCTAQAAQIARVEAERYAERARIIACLKHEAEVCPCEDDAKVIADCALLVEADFSYDEAEAIEDKRTAAEAQIAALTKERDHLAKVNNQQAACLHFTAAELGPDYVATVEGLPKAARHAIATLRAEVKRLRAILATIVSRCDTAKQQCNDGEPISAFNLASAILGQIGSYRDVLPASEKEE